MKKITFSLFAVGSLLALPISSAQAADYGVHVYMSAPQVQGSPLTSSPTLETFDSYPTGTCPTTLTIGTMEGDCSVSAPGTYGGASSSAKTPFTGGTGTNYATTSGGDQVITITLNKPAKYLGLWWSAGSPSNTIQLFSEGTEVAFMTTAALIAKIDGPDVTSKNGLTTYTNSMYFGNPVNSLAPEEPFVYLDLYSVGGLLFDSIKLSGGGFEFDNIAVSDLNEPVDGSLVDVNFIPALVDPPVEEVVPEEAVLANTGSDVLTLGGFALLLLALGSVVTMRSSTSRKSRKN